MKKAVGIAGGEEAFVCPQSLVLNSYQGCGFDCPYCYAKYLFETFNKWTPIEDGKPEDLRNKLDEAESGNLSQISKLLRRKIPIRFANNTDPFQYKEKNARVSLEMLRILNDHHYPVIINTKGTLWSAEPYLSLIENMTAVVQETIITHDDKIAKALEPHAPPSSERLRALNRAKDRGIPLQIRYSPVFPLINDNPRELFTLAYESGVRDIICEFMRFPLVRKYRDRINDELGYDYFNYLYDKGYPLIKMRHWEKVDHDFIFKEYQRFKDIAKEIGLNFYICSEERPEMNNWENCCGVTKYKGMESCMDWTIQMNGYRFGEKPITFDEYIKGLDIPYKKKFRKYWDEGKLEGTIQGLEFNKDDKTYVRRALETKS